MVGKIIKRIANSNPLLKQLFFRKLLWHFRKPNCLKNTSDRTVATIQNLAVFDWLDRERSSVILGTKFPQSLVISPGIYQFNDEQYICKQPGVYRFSQPQKINLQRIVINKQDPVQSSLLLSLISCRGNRDDYHPHKTLEHYALTRLLVMTCGPLVDFVARQIEKYGMICRVVSTHTLESKNSYNNGHALLEVWNPKINRYVVIDLDKKCYFSDKKNLLCVFGLTKRIYNSQSFDIIRISNISMVDWTQFIEYATQFNYQFIEYAIYEMNNGIEQCLRRICQFPIISDSQKTYACAWNPKLRNKIQAINSKWIILDEYEFYQKFYLQNCMTNSESHEY